MFPYLIAGAIGFAVAKIFEDDKTPKYADGGEARPFTDDGNKLVVFNQYRNYTPYKIAVDDINNAEYITLWKTDTDTGKDKKIGYLRLYENSDGFLSVSESSIEDRGSKGLGLGLEMYKTALKYSSDKVKGIVSYLPNRTNKKQIPKIYKKLNSVKDGDYEYILKERTPNIRFDDGGSVLLAPNGKPSNLTPEQYKLVRTPAFKQWFGDWENDPANASKVVDSNGEPLVVYHGTNEEFNVFKMADKFREDWKVRDYGAYFTNSKKTAEFYSLDFEKKKKDYLLFEQKLERLEREDNWQEWKKTYNEQKEKFGLFDLINQFESIKIYECFLSVKNPLIIDGDGENWFKVLKGVVDKALNLNNNGIIVKDIIEQGNDVQTTFIAFQPNQIKLADGTNTTFDGNNPDIRFDKGGEVNSDDIVSFEVLYHGTSKSRYEQIKSNGFDLNKQGEKSGFGSYNGVSLTSNYEIAQEHSEWASDTFEEEGDILIINSLSLRILKGNKFSLINNDFTKAYMLYKKGLIDGVELCDFETGDGCEEYEVFIFNVDKLNQLISNKR